MFHRRVNPYSTEEGVMNPPAMDMESLGQRLGRLERENWRVKRLGGKSAR